MTSDEKKRKLIHALPAIAAANLTALPRPRFGKKPAYVAVLAADLHTDADPYRERTDVLRRAFSGVTGKYGRVNAFVMAGDITNCGDEKEYRLLRRLMRRYLRADLLVPAIGNHDAWHHSDHPCFEIAYRLFQDYCKDCGHNVTENYYTCSDARCNFIVLGTEKTMHNCTYLSEKQLDWLEQQLSRCVKQNKLIVVVNHQTLASRNGGDGGWAEEGQAAVSDRIEALLERYSQKARAAILFVSGHKHMLEKNCFEQANDRLHYLNLPSFEYGDGEGNHSGTAAVLTFSRKQRGANLFFYDFIRQEKIEL